MYSDIWKEEFLSNPVGSKNGHTRIDFTSTNVVDIFIKLLYNHKNIDRLKIKKVIPILHKYKVTNIIYNF